MITKYKNAILSPVIKAGTSLGGHSGVSRGQDAPCFGQGGYYTDNVQGIFLALYMTFQHL